jgi:peptidoglycan/LPS O-acetylase OafA/YrhL
MVTMFVLGALAEERGWIAGGLPRDVRRLCGRAAALGGLAVAVVAVGITLSDDPDPFLGGLRLQATIIPIIEAAIAVGMSMWAVDWFRRRWNRSGRVARGAGRASFAAYLVHAPITIVLAAALRGVGVPAELKFLAVFAASVVASFALGWFVTRLRPVGRVL